jgi:uncharacterized protein (TIGR02646 family)
MIRLGTRPAEPGTLQSPKVIKARRRLAGKTKRGVALSGKDFESYWLEDDVRLTLWDHQGHKCCYCERKIESKREPDIDHFRPKGKVTGATRKNSGYWWLAYDWTNLYFSCKTCNQKHKKNHFPLLKGGRRARAHASNLTNELPVLIDPIEDRPEELIGFTWDPGPVPSKIPLAMPIGKDPAGRGEKTIKILGLDRSLLNDERGGLLLGLHALARKMQAALYLPNATRLLTEAKKEIRETTSAANSFAGFRRAFFRAQGLGEYVAND